MSALTHFKMSRLGSDTLTVLTMHGTRWLIPFRVPDTSTASRIGTNLPLSLYQLWRMHSNAGIIGLLSMWIDVPHP
jgi:hypothetical protein